MKVVVMEVVQQVGKKLAWNNGVVYLVMRWDETMGCSESLRQLKIGGIVTCSSWAGLACRRVYIQHRKLLSV